MKIAANTTWLYYSAIIVLFFHAAVAQADEIGIATGLNISTYKSWKSDKFEYQKINIMNPVEVVYRKDFTGFFGIHSALQYSKRTIYQAVPKTRIDSVNRTIVPGDVAEYEIAKNYLSLEISPIFFHRIKDVLIDAGFGLSGDFYINEWTNQFDEISTMRRKENSSFVLSFVSGIGLGYIIKNRFKIGLRSSISKNLTDIYNRSDDHLNYSGLILPVHYYDCSYLNFQNVVFFSLLL